ncbi:tetraspanin-2a [Hoplias malabaricus]|uniref:tetraspanin-2a n=1 Tax=Hoplias malabaricus TaxID=27720 RepID=UPI0034632B0F
MSKVQGGMKCVKYLLFFFNFIFWLSGSLVLAVGLWLRFDSSISTLLHLDGAPETFFTVVYILIGAGGVMMLVGFFGCCGAVRESQCLLGSFFACLLVIFGAEVAAGVFGFMKKEKVIEEVQHFYTESAQGAVINNTIANTYQNILDCCDVGDDPALPCPENRTKDCKTAIKDFFNEKLFIIGYVGLGIAGVMIIGMIFSMVLCCAIRNNREVI